MHAAPLERGRPNPRKGYGRLSRARTGQRRDVGLVERVSSITSGPVQPSPRCATIPSTAAPSPVLWEPGTTRHHHPRHWASSGLPSATPSNQQTDGNQSGRHPHSHPRSRSWVGTGLATTPAGSDIHQDDHQLHDVVCHTAMCSFRTVWHNCKPPPLDL
jgi:hypothetical protein